MLPKAGGRINPPPPLTETPFRGVSGPAQGARQPWASQNKVSTRKSSADGTLGRAKNNKST